MLKSGLYGNGHSEDKSDDALRFIKSLKELKELRSQIHNAADYCEKTYLNSEDKAAVVDNTREYLCRAVVTVVDHLGCVSANLNCRIEKTDRVAETELRINNLKQKLDSCGQYNDNLTVTKIRLTTDLPRCYSRYISPPSDSNCKDVSLRLSEPHQPVDPARASKPKFKSDEDMPLFMLTSSTKICLGPSPKYLLDTKAKDLTVMPVCDEFSVAPKLMRNPSFHFQEVKKSGGFRRLLHWRSKDDNEILSLIRRSKKERTKLLKHKS